MKYPRGETFEVHRLPEVLLRSRSLPGRLPAPLGATSAVSRPGVTSCRHHPLLSLLSLLFRPPLHFLELLGASRSFSELLGASRRFSELPGALRSFTGHGVAQGISRSSPRLLRASRGRALPGLSRRFETLVFRLPAFSPASRDHRPAQPGYRCRGNRKRPGGVSSVGRIEPDVSGMKRLEQEEGCIRLHCRSSFSPNGECPRGAEATVSGIRTGLLMRGNWHLGTVSSRTVDCNQQTTSRARASAHASAGCICSCVCMGTQL